MDLNCGLSNWRTLFLAIWIGCRCFFHGQAQEQPPSLLPFLPQHLADHHIPGAMVSIVRSDTVLFSGGLGLANVETNEKVSASHGFRLGSVAKSFTALAMLSLLEEKGLSLNTPVNQIDPDLPIVNAWEAEAPVTIAHLLEHTAGFDDFHLHALYNRTDSVVPKAREMVDAHKNSYTCKWKPGVRKAYSNPGYILVGHLIEKLSGRSYGEYIHATILKPLGMESSGYYFTKPMHIPFSRGYRKVGKEILPISFTSIQGGPAGEFCTNAEDMSKYLQFLLRKDTTVLDAINLPHTVFDRIEHAHTNVAARKGLPHGYGLGTYSIWKNGYLFLGHDGGIDGFSARYLYSREADLGVAVAINREGNATAMAHEILDFLVGEEPLQARTTQKIPEEMAEKMEGFYEYHSPRNQLFSFTDKMFAGISLDVQEEYVLTRSILGKARDTLYHAGDGLFYKNQEGVPSALSFVSEKGETAWWMNESYWLQSSRVLRLVKFFGLILSLLGIISFGVFEGISALVRLVRRKEKHPLSHYLLLGACCSFGLMFLAFSNAMSDLPQAGNLNLNSGLFFISPFLMTLCTLGALGSWKRMSNRTVGRKLYDSWVLLSCLVMILYLWKIGFVGLPLWSY
ncbi:MAG: serine hydrolase domain-containing protein [Bacteroidota bacterium]